LASEVQTSAHLLITSRMNLDLTESFDHLTQITIAAQPSDVETYLDAKMKANARMRSHLARDKALRNDIINNLVEKTDGMLVRFPQSLCLITDGYLQVPPGPPTDRIFMRSHKSQTSSLIVEFSGWQIRRVL
jgi:hypothetical protein